MIIIIIINITTGIITHNHFEIRVLSMSHSTGLAGEPCQQVGELWGMFRDIVLDKQLILWSWKLLRLYLLLWLSWYDYCNMICIYINIMSFIF